VIEFELHSVECVDVVAGQCKWAAKRWEKSPPAAVPAVKQIVYSRRCRATSLFFIDNLYWFFTRSSTCCAVVEIIFVYCS